MVKLLKLEWKKNQLSKYILSAMISMVVIFALSCLMAVLSQGEGEPMFDGYDSFIAFVNMMIRIVFQIFASILLSRLVIDEYSNKTIQVLFTYPVNRKKVMQCKLLLVCLFTFISITIATVCSSILTYFINPVLHLFDGEMVGNDFLSTLPMNLIFAIMVAGIGLIPLYFGMKKKSTATTITSAVIISLLLNSTVSGSGSSSGSVSIFEFIAMPIGLGLLGFLIGYLGYRNVNKKDLV